MPCPLRCGRTLAFRQPALPHSTTSHSSSLHCSSSISTTHTPSDRHPSRLAHHVIRPGPAGILPADPWRVVPDPSAHRRAANGIPSSARLPRRSRVSPPSPRVLTPSMNAAPVRLLPPFLLPLPLLFSPSSRGPTRTRSPAAVALHSCAVDPTQPYASALPSSRLALGPPHPTAVHLAAADRRHRRSSTPPRPKTTRIAVAVWPRPPRAAVSARSRAAVATCCAKRRVMVRQNVPEFGMPSRFASRPQPDRSLNLSVEAILLIDR